MDEPSPPLDASVPARSAAPIERRIDWRQELLLLATVTLLLTGADQWTKGWAVGRLGPLTQDAAGRFRAPPDSPPLEIWDGYLRLSLTGNSGAIFGLGRALPESLKRPLFIGLSVLAMAFIAALIRSSQPDQRLRRLGLAAVLAGALGNLIDRLGMDYVVDFIDWYGGFHWPTFNVADVSITAGVLLTVLDLWLHPDPIPSAAPPDPTPPVAGQDPNGPATPGGDSGAAAAREVPGPAPSHTQGPQA